MSTRTAVGVPFGGQFATSRKAEAGISLTAAPSDPRPKTTAPRRPTGTGASR